MTPSLHTVKIAGAVNKTVYTVGSGDLSDTHFVNRIFRDAGVDTRLKSFDKGKYTLKVIESREIRSLG